MFFLFVFLIEIDSGGILSWYQYLGTAQWEPLQDFTSNLQNLIYQLEDIIFISIEI